MLAIARAASQAGHTVRVAALSRGGSLREAVQLDFHAEVIARPGWRRFLNRGRLSDSLEEFVPDILHVTLVRPALIGVPVAASLHVPHIVITQNGIHEWNEGGRLAGLIVPALFRRSARLASRVVAISGAVSRDLERAGVDSAKLMTIHNGVDTCRFEARRKSADLRQVLALRFQLDADRMLLVGAAGNLRRIKGHEYLVRAIPDIMQQHPHARFCIWGEGPERSHLEAMIAKLGLQSVVALPGRAGDMPDRLLQVDVFVQPSLSEGFGLAAAEAMSCALPVVASGTGGLAELIEDGRSGILVSPASSDKLAGAINRLLADRALRSTLGDAARRRVVESFSIGQMCLQYLGLYGSLQSSRGAE